MSPSKYWRLVTSILIVFREAGYRTSKYKEAERLAYAQVCKGYTQYQHLSPDQEYLCQCWYLYLLLTEGISVFDKNYKNLKKPLQDFS